MTPSLSEFKQGLERTLKIVSWSPTEHDLITIAREVARARVNAPDDLSNIVSRVCPETLRIFTEGLDNSDLRTLLILATAAVAQG